MGLDASRTRKKMLGEFLVPEKKKKKNGTVEEEENH